MLLKELPDWSNVLGLSGLSVLRHANASDLGHFVILDIELQGVRSLKLLEVGSRRIDKVLSVLKANLGRSLDEIGQLAIDA